MERRDFKRAINELFWFFQKTPPAENVIDEIWFPSVKHIDRRATPWIIDQLKDMENLPRNLTKAILSLYMQWKRDRPNCAEYDPEDDPNFPVNYLWAAYRILESKGEEEFKGFCNRIKMPNEDRKRVRNKLRVAMEQGDSAQMAKELVKGIYS